MMQERQIDTPAEIVKSARLAAGLTQRALAERAGTAQSVIARIETAATSPSWDTLDRLVAATGHSLVVSIEPAAINRITLEARSTPRPE
jgi:uncharacterized protein